jgi:WD40 repeat protein
MAAAYRAEYDEVLKQGIAKRFPPVFLDKAGEFARRGDAALKAGRLQQARQAFLQARWQLPYQPPDVPPYVARILGSLRLRHSKEVLAVAISADGTKLASASKDATVKIWDTGNGHERVAYTGHHDEVSCVAFSPDGKSVASGGKDHSVKIWDTATGKDLTTIKAEGESVVSVVFARDGKHLITSQTAAGQSPGLVAIYETATGALKRKITDFRGRVSSVALNFDGSILGAGVEDGSIRLWQFPAVMDKGAQPAYWTKQDDHATYAIAFSPDNRTLARIGADSIKLYSLALPLTPHQAAAPRRTISLPPSVRHTCAVFSQDGKTLYTGSNDNVVKLWDPDSGQLVGTFKGHGGEIKGLAVNPITNQLASASTDFTVRLWDYGAVTQARDLVGHAGAVWTAAFSPTGQRIVSASADHTVRIWDAGTGETLHALKGHTSAVTTALFSPDGQMVLSGAGDKLVKLWNAASGALIRSCEGHTGAITALDFSPDGKRFASGSADKTVRVWDTKSGTPQLTLGDAKSIVGALAFSPDGLRIAVGYVDQSIQLFDTATGKEQAAWPGHGIAVTGLSFSRNGRWLASCGVDQLVRVWPLATPGKNPITLAGHTGPLSSVAFRADSKHLVSAGSDQTVRLWVIDNDMGRESQTYRGHRDWVTSAAFSRDGHYVVSSGVERVIKIWEITTNDIPLQAEHTGSIDAVAFSPDGRLIATAGTDKTIRVWDRDTGLDRLTLVGHTDLIYALALTPDSKTLVSSSEDRTIRQWDMATGKELPRLPGQQQAFTGLPKSVVYVALAPDGKKLLAWVHGDERYQTIAGYDLASGTELFSFNDQGRNIRAIAFSADGTRAASGALDGSVRIFDLDKKGMLLPGGDWFLYGKGVQVGDVALSPDGATLVAGSDAGDVKVCLVSKKETLKTIKAHTAAVVACLVSPDGKRFATAGADNNVKLWDLGSGAELRSWNLGGPLRVNGGLPLAFSPDGKQLVAGNANTTAYVLDLP